MYVFLKKTAQRIESQLENKYFFSSSKAQSAGSKRTLPSVYGTHSRTSSTTVHEYSTLLLLPYPTGATRRFSHSVRPSQNRTGFHSLPFDANPRGVAKIQSNFFKVSPDRAKFKLLLGRQIC